MTEEEWKIAEKEIEDVYSKYNMSCISVMVGSGYISTHGAIRTEFSEDKIFFIKMLKAMHEHFHMEFEKIIKELFPEVELDKG